jgi:hypothetical protein
MYSNPMGPVNFTETATCQRLNRRGAVVNLSGLLYMLVSRFRMIVIHTAVLALFKTRVQFVGKGPQLRRPSLNEFD